MEQDEEWTTGQKYLDMDEYWEWKKSQESKKAAKTVVTVVEAGVVA